MKLSTRSRYGTRMMLDLAQNYDKGPVPIRDIAKRQDISVKYLEQLIIPLKKAKLIKSVRGPKGGHMLSKAPHEINVGDLIQVLEGEVEFIHCVSNPNTCDKREECLTRGIWEEASKAMVEKLNATTLSDVISRG